MKAMIFVCTIALTLLAGTNCDLSLEEYEEVERTDPEVLFEPWQGDHLVEHTPKI